MTHPAIVLAVAWLCWIAIDQARRRFEPSSNTTRAAGLAVGLIAVTVYAAIVVWYALQPVFFDPAEPTITAVSAVFAAGRPLYPALDAPERYAHIYGPDLFIFHAAAMRLLGARVLVSKAVGAISALGGLFLTYRAFVRVVSPRDALAAVGVCALVYLEFGDTTFWTRPEPLLILCTAAALYGSTSGSSVASIALVGIATAVAWNLKVSAPLYILPLFTVLVTRARWRGAFAVAAIAIPLAAAPFLIKTISFVHYAQYIRLSAGNGLMMARLRQNIEWAVVLMSPLAAGLVCAAANDHARARIDPLLTSLCLSIVALIVIAAKPGAGPYHLLPAVPVIAYAVLRLPARVWGRSAPRAMAAALVTTAVVFAWSKQIILIRTVRGRDLAQATIDVREFLDGHPSASVGVGYAGTSRSSDARVEAVFRTHDYWLDAPAVQEYRLAGLPMPASVITALAECRTRYWLIPRGGEPFLVPSAYWPAAGPPRVFPDAFRDAFLRAYRRVGETRYFAVWECARARR